MVPTPPKNRFEDQEAANEYRQQERLDAEKDAYLADPDNLAKEKAANITKSPYGPYTAKYEADIALHAIGFEELWTPEDTHDETWDIYLQSSEWQEVFPWNHDVEDGVYSPFINRFWRQLWLIASDLAVVKKELFHNSKNPEKILKNTKHPEGAQRIIKWIQDLNSTERIQENQQNFDWDFTNELKNFTNGDGEYEGLSSEVYTAISVRYFRIWEKSPESIDMAFEMGLSPFIRDIIPDTRDIQLQNLIDIVKNKDSNRSFQERFIAFTNILENIHTEHWAKGGRRKLDLQVAQQRKIMKETGLEERFLEAQQQLQIAQEAKDTKAIAITKAQIEELTEQASLWDIWADWDIALETWWVEGSNNESAQKTA